MQYAQIHSGYYLVGMSLSEPIIGCESNCAWISFLDMTVCLSVCIIMHLPLCHLCRSMLMIWIAFGIVAIGTAVNIVPVYPELLKLGG